MMRLISGRLSSRRPAKATNSLAVLLDFAKAYATLDRRFLSLTLKRHGFSSNMITATEDMHLGTTATYAAEDQVSATTGIRQGCPLAPTLFILAVDVLYEMITNSTLTGLMIEPAVPVSVVGFADDTTVYLSHPKDTQELQRLLHRFATTSGLHVNVSKSHCICMLESGLEAAQRDSVFPVAAPTQTIRYLGSLVATTSVTDTIWDAVLQQLRARLHLAAIKTTDLLQRIQVGQAIIVPKLLFTARHTWPTARQVERLQTFVDNYIWRGQFASTSRNGRAWVGQDVAAAPRSEGGLQLPCICTELLVLAVATVQRWASATLLISECIGRTLRHAAASGPVTPGRGSAHQPRLTSSIATTGHSVLRAATSLPVSEEERAVIARLLPRAGKALSTDGTWEHGWYRRSYLSIYSDLKELRTIQRHRAGKLNVTSMLHTPIIGMDLLLHHTGRPLRHTDLPGLDVSNRTVNDLIDIHWINPTTLGFRLREATYPYESASSFRLLCDTLVMCYPELLLHHDPIQYLEERGHTHDVWIVQREVHQVRLLHDIQGHAPTDLGQVPNLRQAESLARRATGRTRLQFKPHPWLSPLLPLWGSAARVSRKALRQIISASTLERARAHLERRRQRALQTTPAFQEALDAVDWSDVHLLEHSSSRQRLLCYRIKGHFLSGWDNANHRRGCPHCVTAGSDGGTTIHIVWQCPLAQNLWLQLRSWWQRLGLFTESSASSNDSFFRAIFSLELPQTPPRAWDLATLHQCPSSTIDIAADPYPVLQAVWRQLALETMVLIHSWRNANDEGASQRSSQQARALHEANCTRILRTIATRYAANPKVPPQAAGLVWKLLSVFNAKENQYK